MRNMEISTEEKDFLFGSAKIGGSEDAMFFARFIVAKKSWTGTGMAEKLKQLANEAKTPSWRPSIHFDENAIGLFEAFEERFPENAKENSVAAIASFEALGASLDSEEAYEAFQRLIGYFEKTGVDAVAAERSALTEKSWFTVEKGELATLFSPKRHEIPYRLPQKGETVYVPVTDFSYGGKATISRIDINDRSDPYNRVMIRVSEVSCSAFNWRNLLRLQSQHQKTYGNGWARNG